MIPFKNNPNPRMVSQEKMQEINEAYDQIVDMRKNGKSAKGKGCAVASI